MGGGQDGEGPSTQVSYSSRCCPRSATGPPPHLHLSFPQCPRPLLTSQPTSTQKRSELICRAHRGRSSLVGKPGPVYLAYDTLGHAHDTSNKSPGNAGERNVRSSCSGHAPAGRSHYSVVRAAGLPQSCAFLFTSL